MALGKRNKSASSKVNRNCLALDQVTILPELKSLIPDRTSEEKQLLLEDIKANGQKLPAIVTELGGKTVLVDGHGRYESLVDLGKDRIKIEHRDFENLETIKLEMYKIQLGRRNLSDKDKALFIGRIFNNAKELKSMGHSDPQPTRASIAHEHKVSEATVKRSASYAKAFDELKPEHQKIVSKPEVTQKAVIAIAKIDDEAERDEVVGQIAECQSPLEVKDVLDAKAKCIGVINQYKADKPQLRFKGIKIRNLTQEEYETIDSLGDSIHIGNIAKQLLLDYCDRK